MGRNKERKKPSVFFFNFESKYCCGADLSCEVRTPACMIIETLSPGFSSRWLQSRGHPHIPPW